MEIISPHRKRLATVRHPVPTCAALAVVVCAGLIATSAQAEPLDLTDGEHILNLSARDYGALPSGLPTHPVDFPAGEYLIETITPDTHGDADYVAWSHAFGQEETWHTAWRAYLNDEEEIFVNGGQFTAADSAAEALAATDPDRLLRSFVLDVPATLRFGFGDNQISDNQRGVSLRVTVIPEPSTMALLVLGGVSLIGCRRRAAATKHHVT